MMTYEKIKRQELKALESRAIANPCYRSMVAFAKKAAELDAVVEGEYGSWTVESMIGDGETEPSYILIVTPHWDRIRVPYPHCKHCKRWWD